MNTACRRIKFQKPENYYARKANAFLKSRQCHVIQLKKKEGIRMNARYWIEQLEMEAHPEGGYFKQSLKSNQTISSAGHEGKRSLYTSIYFLLQSGDVSHFHQLRSDEVWYYHAGSPLTVHIIDESGNYRQEKLGLDFEKGERPQVCVEKGSIFGSTVDEKEAYALVGCMVSPGFEFDDFKLFRRSELLASFPQHEAVINRLAYENPSF
jgi:predicted cupin superfamily sugar epimerase